MDRGSDKRSFENTEPKRGDSSRGDRSQKGVDENRKNNVDENRSNTNVDNRGRNDLDNRNGRNDYENRRGNTINNNRNVQINQINQRNTYVRANTVVYTRPPYRYGGFSYYSYNPYFYHGYQPYGWGPSWHPVGFFVATVAATAIVVSVANAQYQYDDGVFYHPSGDGYEAVAAPVGATVPEIPGGAQKVVVNQTTNYYYYGGAYYEKSDKGYTVVAPIAGTVVDKLPEGGEEVKIGDQTYVKVGETYYQPIQKDGKNMYEVVEVKKEGQ